MGSQSQREKHTTGMPKENAEEDTWHLSERQNTEHLDTQDVNNNRHSTTGCEDEMEMGRPRGEDAGRQMDGTRYHIGKRLPGRPRRKWSDLFRKQTGRQWTCIARNRKEWKELELQISDQV
ncbi:uncharacterized protein LOC126203512 [Schistocerca nitens]|uniref:uncharacterized protein LOC126203512 n=1 Tax=Schistocerca nitens TaxID=7011 RepID=UPI0021179A88|nr:uncharacterized protein LOC126203512 [Schistocerca nitens]